MEEAIALDSIQAIAASFGASFDAEKIIDTVLEKDGTRYYKVRWVKYSWEPAASFTHLEHLIRAFWSQYAQNPETVDESNKSQDASKILEQANVAQTLAQVVEAEGKSVPSILTSLNPIVGNLGQVATPAELHIQQQNLQLAAASFSQMHSVEPHSHQQLEMLSNIQAIPINVPQEHTQTPAPVNRAARKTTKTKKLKDPNEPLIKKNNRRKIPGTCNICGKLFKSTTNIAAHRKLHTEERQFACAQCGKKFRRKLHLTRHLESHAGIKSFVCNICGSAFSSKWYMQAHTVVHTGEKPYECEICEKRFNNKANLSKHKLIHANKRPFVCNICGQTYRQSYDLKRHMTTHSEEKAFRCNQCEKSFARKTYLQRHMLTHTGEKKFQCSLCERKFIQRGQLNFHMKQHQPRNKTNKDTLESNSSDDIIFEKDPMEREETDIVKECDNDFMENPHPSSSMNTVISAENVPSVDTDVTDDIFIVQPSMDSDKQSVAMVTTSTNVDGQSCVKVVDCEDATTENALEMEKRHFLVDHTDYFQSTESDNPRKVITKHVVPVDTKQVMNRLFSPEPSSENNTLNSSDKHNADSSSLASETVIKEDAPGNFSGEHDNLLVFPNSTQTNTTMFL